MTQPDGCLNWKPDLWGCLPSSRCCNRWLESALCCLQTQVICQLFFCWCTGFVLLVERLVLPFVPRRVLCSSCDFDTMFHRKCHLHLDVGGCQWSFWMRTRVGGRSTTQLLIHTLAWLAILFTPDTLIVFMGGKTQTAITSSIGAIVQSH